VTLALTRKNVRSDLALFSESGARFLVSVAPANVAAVTDLIQKSGLVLSGEGTVGGDTISVRDIASVSAATAFTKWFNGLDHLFEA
jgi:hypothetical protein